MDLFFFFPLGSDKRTKENEVGKERTDVVATEAKESGDTTVSSVEIGDRGGGSRDVGRKVRREETKEASVLWIQVTLHHTDACDWKGLSITVLFLVQKKS